jgi:hypothetical protein
MPGYSVGGRDRAARRSPMPAGTSYRSGPGTLLRRADSCRASPPIITASSRCCGEVGTLVHDTIHEFAHQSTERWSSSNAPFQGEWLRAACGRGLGQICKLVTMYFFSIVHDTEISNRLGKWRSSVTRLVEWTIGAHCGQNPAAADVGEIAAAAVPANPAPAPGGMGAGAGHRSGKRPATGGRGWDCSRPGCGKREPGPAVSPADRG